MSFDEEHLDEHYECQREVAERDARIAQLEATNATLRLDMEHFEAAVERVAQLEAALERYAGHDPDCPCLIRRECLCGFGAALAPKEPT